MGFFDVHCAATHLALRDSTRLLLLGSENDGPFRPAALPLVGCYDRFGGIDSIEMDASAQALQSLIKEFSRFNAGKPPFDQHLREMNHGVFEDAWITWKSYRVSYALVDDAVYRAVVGTIVEGGRKDLVVPPPSDLEAMPFEKLHDLAFPGSELAHAVLGGIPPDRRASLKPALVEYAAFLRWGFDLKPIDLGDGDQYGDLDDEPVRDAIDDARERFKEYPLILDAIRQNEESWSE